MLKVRARNKPCCPLCRVELSGERYTCSECNTVYDQDCAVELGGCGTLGCRRMGVKPDEPTPDDQRWRARARRRSEANRARRTSGIRLRERHVDDGGEASRSWLPVFFEFLFWLIFGLLG